MQKAKLGPDNNSTAYTYIYIYIHTHYFILDWLHSEIRTHANATHVYFWDLGSTRQHECESLLSQEVNMQVNVKATGYLVKASHWSQLRNHWLIFFEVLMGHSRCPTCVQCVLGCLFTLQTIAGTGWPDVAFYLQHLCLNPEAFCLRVWTPKDRSLLLAKQLWLFQLVLRNRARLVMDDAEEKRPAADITQVLLTLGSNIPTMPLSPAKTYDLGPSVS